MSDRFFISYSSVDGEDFSLKLGDALTAGPPAFPVWLDKRELRPGENWDEQIVEAIRTCKAMLFVMTKDSVEDLSVCKDEWVKALKYKKPIIPLLVNQETELPFRLSSREYINFTKAFDTALARLRNHLTWLDTPEGQLQALKYRMADAQRDLKRVEPEQQSRIQAEIKELKQQIEQQQFVIANPEEAEKRVQQNIDQGLERVRKPDKPVNEGIQSKFINPPPLIAPTWFQDRHLETKLIGDFLRDDALRLMTIIGRGGIGKTAMVCRLLRSLESAQLPYDGGPLTINGIVYLSDARSFHRVNVADLYAGLIKLLPKEQKDQLDALYKNPQTKTLELMQALTEAFPIEERTVVLLDNFEDEIDVATGELKSEELKDALIALLELPPHGLKIIITSRIAPHEFATIQPGLQTRINLDTGLEYPYAESVLKAMDADSKIGLRDAPEPLLTLARERTRGFPRALEHLFGILSADRNTSLQEILDNTKKLLPEQVVTVLVGEAFSRLDITAQRVMQALAIYRYPVPPTAVDYLLQPFVPGIDSGQVLGRLVNMQFVHREAGRYYLHQIDRDYALNRIPEGEPANGQMEPLPFSRFALQYRAAEWFKLVRKPREDWKSLQDINAQLQEFELRCACGDYDTAAALLLEIEFDYLILWGHFRLVTGLHDRLEGKVTDSWLIGNSVGNLGTAYYRMGEFQKAIKCYEQALGLALEQKTNEGTWLGNLGNCYAEIGETDKAIEYYDQALILNRKFGDRKGEAINLGNFGTGYSDRGQIALSIDYYNQAAEIHREIENPDGLALILSNLGDSYAELGKTDEAMRYFEEALSLVQNIGYRFLEAGTFNNIGYLYLDQSEWTLAIQQLKHSIEIADDIANIQYQKEARLGLVLAYLYQDQLKAAAEIALDAMRLDFPLSNPNNAAIIGIIELLQNHTNKAKETFDNTLLRIERLLVRNQQSYNLVKIKALVLCGLTLCGGRSYIEEAKEAFKAARVINSEAGLVHRTLQLFDVLAKADKLGLLAEIRQVAAGKT